MNIHIGSSETTREAPNTIQATEIRIVNQFTFSNYILPEHKKNINFSFLEWFIGFSENNNCFCSRIENNRIRLSFEITQKDLQLMHKIRTTLGFGKVRSFKNNNETYYKYIVENKQSLQRIMLLFNGNFVLMKKYIQFADWVQAEKNICPVNFSLKLQRVQVSLTTGWLAGFIEAQGCFYADFQSINLNTRDFLFIQRLTITQKDTHNESLVLQQIIDLFKSNGKLRLAKKPDWYRVDFNCLKSQTIIVSYLTQYPFLGKKKIVYRRWWRIYLRRQKPELKLISLKTIKKLKRLCSMIND